MKSKRISRKPYMPGRRVIGACTAALMMTAILVPVGTVSAAQTQPVSDNTGTVAASADFADYAEQYGTAPWASTPVELTSGQVSAYTGEQTDVTYVQRTHVTLLYTSQSLSWTVDIPQDGRYGLALTYCAIPGRGSSPEFSLACDGMVPYAQAEAIPVTRVWKDADGVTRDANDNDIQPEQTEVQQWRTVTLRDTTGYSDDRLFLYLTAGTHVLTMTAVNEDIAVQKLTLTGETVYPSYKDYAAQVGTQTVQTACIPVEAENTAFKSDSSIYMTSDYSSPVTSPSDPVKIRLNTIGQVNWKYSGQWVTWNVRTEKAGYYRISVKYRQNFVRGIATARRLYINGEIPFKEAQYFYFPFTNGFEMQTLGDEEGTPYLFYLNEGDNTLSLEVVLGEISQTLVDADKIVYDLNSMYRQIIMITGTTPDTLRDYYLDSELPEMVPLFTRCAAALRECTAQLEAKSFAGSQAAIFDQVAYQLESFVRDPGVIPKRLSNFKSNLSTLASTILQFKEQPLELDTLYVTGTDERLPSSHAGFWQTISYRTRSFFGSFFEDYNAVGATQTQDSEHAITVWANSDTTGREQLSVLKRLIDNDFTPAYNTTVRLSLVSGGQTLTQAILAGAGPDAAIFIDEATPVNLAMRGALEDLSDYYGFEKLTGWFCPSAFTPYKYEGGIYALPETQLYNMLFYRTDVFNEMKLSVPTTWEEFFVMSSALQKSNLEIGIPESVQLFETLVLQNGGEYFNASNTRTCFDTSEALSAFALWTSFYRYYSYPVGFDAYSRFRTGEMPVVVMPYSFYSTLAVAAPELKGKWAMTAMPGVATRDGVNQTESCTGTGVIMMSNSQNKRACFDFMCWWVSADIQSRYGNDVEAQMGTGARYTTANKEAFARLPWSLKEQQLLLTQWDQVEDVPVNIANYYVTRNLTNAFRRVVYYSENQRETLLHYNTIINNEIRRKRTEYGLSLE